MASMKWMHEVPRQRHEGFSAFLAVNKRQPTGKRLPVELLVAIKRYLDLMEPHGEVMLILLHVDGSNETARKMSVVSLMRNGGVMTTNVFDGPLGEFSGHVIGTDGRIYIDAKACHSADRVLIEMDIDHGTIDSRRVLSHGIDYPVFASIDDGRRRYSLAGDDAGDDGGDGMCVYCEGEDMHMEKHSTPLPLTRCGVQHEIMMNTPPFMYGNRLSISTKVGVVSIAPFCNGASAFMMHGVNRGFWRTLGDSRLKIMMPLSNGKVVVFWVEVTDDDTSVIKSFSPRKQFAAMDCTAPRVHVHSRTVVAVSGFVVVVEAGIPQASRGGDLYRLLWIRNECFEPDCPMAGETVSFILPRSWGFLSLLMRRSIIKRQ